MVQGRTRAEASHLPAERREALIEEKETDDDENNPIKYLTTNTIDALTEYVIRSYSK